MKGDDGAREFRSGGMFTIPVLFATAASSCPDKDKCWLALCMANQPSTAHVSPRTTKVHVLSVEATQRS